MITTTEAIQSLVPNAPAHYISTATDRITGWDVAEVKTGIARPTDEELATEVTRLQGVYDALEYSRLRKAKYDLLNQDEMRYDDLINNTTTWRDGIAAIKAAHPKP